MTSIGALLGQAVGRAMALDGLMPHTEFVDPIVCAVDQNTDELVRYRFESDVLTRTGW